MPIRFVTRKVHAYIDYPVAASLTGMPFLLGLGATNPLALWLSVVTGLAAFVLTLLTDHETGVIRILPYAWPLPVGTGRANGRSGRKWTCIFRDCPWCPGSRWRAPWGMGMIKSPASLSY